MLGINIKEISIRTDSESGQKYSVIRDKIDFILEQNKIFTILGKNGSGKSTFIKCLTGLLDNRYKIHGRVIFNDIDLLTADFNSLLQIRKNKIKYVFQDSVNSFDHLKKFDYYFNNLVKERKKIDDLLEYFLLPPKEKLFKLYPYEVSGGMAQRISFILALLAEPEIIILDEPTSGIDHAISNLFLLKLKDFVNQNGNSVLLVTQDMVFAEKVSNKIAYLNEGILSPFLEPEAFFREENINRM